MQPTYYAVGKEIVIEEMPSGCVVHNDTINDPGVEISAPEDAELLINSLLKMLRIQFPEYKVHLRRK